MTRNLWQTVLEINIPFLKTFLFLKAYKNLYVKPQPNNKGFTQRRRQQQLIAFNTPSSKGYS